ncbi:shikimate dehydrogenase [Vagococcus sp.]|uniref:shikimate dehydrogenase n=1 Tax=Vagococcus sp. TaxID=1933889 RepID=UPI003F956C85
MITGQTRLAGVMATPIKHSLSPFIHNSGYAMTQTDACYLAFDIEPENFDEAFKSIRSLDMLGVNISMPYKKRAFEKADSHTKVAKILGVCNTLIHREGTILGANTDGAGFVSSLEEVGISLKDKKIVILGAGGAAKAIACQCGLEQAKETHIFKRENKTFGETMSYFKKLAKEVNSLYYVHPYEATQKMTDCLLASDILINATNIGMGTLDLPMASLAGLHSQLYVADLIYYPLETQLMREAKSKGCATQNGLGMLVHQAAIAFEMMTGKKMPVASVTENVLLELKKNQEKDKEN